MLTSRQGFSTAHKFMFVRDRYLENRSQLLFVMTLLIGIDPKRKHIDICITPGVPLPQLSHTTFWLRFIKIIAEVHKIPINIIKVDRHKTTSK